MTDWQELEQEHDREKLQLASTWKAEKLGLEAALEKVQNELAFTKTNLERCPDLCSFSL